MFGVQRLETPLAAHEPRQPDPRQGPCHQFPAPLAQTEVRRHEDHARDMWPQHGIARGLGRQRAAGRGSDQHHPPSDPLAHRHRLGRVAPPVIGADRGQRRPVAAMTRQPRQKQVRPQLARQHLRHRAQFLGTGGKAVQIDQREVRLRPRRPRPQDAARGAGTHAVFGRRRPSIQIGGQVHRDRPQSRHLSRGQKPDPRQQGGGDQQRLSHPPHGTGPPRPRIRSGQGRADRKSGGRPP